MKNKIIVSLGVIGFTLGLCWEPTIFAQNNGLTITVTMAGSVNHEEMQIICTSSPSLNGCEDTDVTNKSPFPLTLNDNTKGMLRFSDTGGNSTEFDYTTSSGKITSGECKNNRRSPITCQWNGGPNLTIEYFMK